MKNIFLISFLLCSFLANAQFGARLGVDLATVKVEVSDSFYSESLSENHTGYYFGVFGNLYIADSFSFRPELNYYYFPKEEEANLVDQIQIPLLFSITFGNVVDLILGPSASYLFNVQGDSKSINYSGNLGLAIKLGESMQLEGRYVKGFANLAGSDPDFDITTNLDAVQIGLTYSLK